MGRAMPYKENVTLPEVIGVLVAILALGFLGGYADYWVKKKIIKDAIQEIEQEKNSAKTPKGT